MFSSWYQLGNSPAPGYAVADTAARPPVPVPLSGTACGEFAALSTSCSEAASGPGIVGANATVTAQLEPAATNVPVHVSLTSVNSLASAPTIAIVAPSGAFPLFVTVTVCPALTVRTRWPANVRLGGTSDTTGAAPASVAVPVRVTRSGMLKEALCETSSSAALTPRALGLNVTSTVHVASAASDPPVQLSATIVNSDALAPESAAPLTVTGVSNRLVTVIVRAALAEF